MPELVLPAVDVEVGADDEAALVRCEEGHRGGDFHGFDGAQRALARERRLVARGDRDGVQAWFLAKSTAPGTASSGPMISSASIVNPASRSQPSTWPGWRW